MPRKAAATTETTAEPRRSSRIKEQPKPEPAPKKAPAKPRTKKVKEPAAEGEEKPKSTKGRKRTAAEKDAEDGAAVNGDEPPAKKVRVVDVVLPPPSLTRSPSHRLSLPPRLPTSPPARPLVLSPLPRRLERDQRSRHRARVQSLRRGPPRSPRPLPRSRHRVLARRSRRPRCVVNDGRQ